MNYAERCVQSGAGSVTPIGHAGRVEPEAEAYRIVRRVIDERHPDYLYSDYTDANVRNALTGYASTAEDAYCRTDLRHLCADFEDRTAFALMVEALHNLAGMQRTLARDLLAEAVQRLRD